MSNPIPTIGDVLRVFDAHGDKYVQAGSVRGHLQAEGFDPLGTTEAINAAIAQNLLALNERGSLYRP